MVDGKAGTEQRRSANPHSIQRLGAFAWAFAGPLPAPAVVPFTVELFSLTALKQKHFKKLFENPDLYETLPHSTPLKSRVGRNKM